MLMQFSVSKGEFCDALALVGRAIASRSSHPILSMVKIEASAEDQSLRLTGFDLSQGIVRTIPAMVEASGAYCFPYKLTSDIFGKMPDVPLTVSVAGNVAEVGALSGEYSVMVQCADEYPDLPAVSADAIELDAAELREAIKLVAYACSDDDSKAILTGVNFKKDAVGLLLAATDGHRLAATRIETDADLAGVTIPEAALQSLGKLLAKHQGPVAIAVDKGQVVFSFDDHLLTTRTLDGNYPNWQALVPKEFKTSIECDRQALIDALERVGIVASQGKSTVVCHFVGGELNISVDAQDIGRAKESLPVQGDGELRIAFNCRYLLEAVKAVPGEICCINLNTELQPVTIGDGMPMALIMPVQIRS